MSDLSILLIEDEQSVCCEFVSTASRLGKMHIVAHTGSASEAYSLTVQHSPDAVILDLELHAGEGSGVDYLQHLKSNPPADIPFIVVTTNNSSRIIYDSVRALGADFIYCKHQYDYSPEKVLSFIQKIYETARGNIKRPGGSPDPNDLSSPAAVRLLGIIDGKLESLGMSRRLAGFEMLKFAIYSSAVSSVRSMYERVALQFDKPVSNVSQVMQYAIDRTWKKTAPQVLMEQFTAPYDPDRGVPTVGEFVAYYAHIVALSQ